MGVVIDSSVFIASERGTFDLPTRLGQRAGEEAALAAITASELLHGVHRATHATAKARREVFVERASWRTWWSCRSTRWRRACTPVFGRAWPPRERRSDLTIS